MQHEFGAQALLLGVDQEVVEQVEHVLSVTSTALLLHLAGVNEHTTR